VFTGRGAMRGLAGHLRTPRHPTVMTSTSLRARLAVYPVRGQAFSSSSAASTAAFYDAVGWARAGVSLQAVAGIGLTATVLWQAGRQAELERKLAHLEEALGEPGTPQRQAYTEAAEAAGGAGGTLHEYSTLQRVAVAMMGPGAKFGDLCCAIAAFPLACATVAAGSTRAAAYMRKRAGAAAKQALKAPEV
jgi:hypothetical protein